MLKALTFLVGILHYQGIFKKKISDRESFNQTFLFLFYPKEFPDNKKIILLQFPSLLIAFSITCSLNENIPEKIK